MSTRYGPMEQNPAPLQSPLDVLNSAAFGPAVLRAIQTPSFRSYAVTHAAPWDFIDLPMVDDLPQSPKDRSEVNLLVGDGVTRMVYRQATDRWYQIGAAPLVTSLPTASLVVGMQVVYVADAASSTLWTLAYYPAGSATFPWAFIGGSPLETRVDTAEALAVTFSTYQALATAGPSVTIPLAGDYYITHGSRGVVGSAALTGAIHSYDVGGTGAVDADGAVFVASAANEQGSVIGRRGKTISAASTAIVSKYRSSTNNAATFSHRWLSAVPVRVG